MSNSVVTVFISSNNLHHHVAVFLMSHVSFLVSPSLSTSLSMAFHRRHHFTAVPSAPDVCSVDDICDSCVKLTWEKPNVDGGKAILGYVIEYKEPTSSRWMTYNTAPVKDTMTSGTACVRPTAYRESVSVGWGDH